MKAARFRLGAFVALALIAVVTGGAQQAGAVSTTLDISQVYGGGGNTGAPYQNDYVELFNRSNALVDLNGMSVQYTSATGTGNFGSATNLITPLSGLLAPGQYVLVQEAGSTAVGIPLPPPVITDPTPIAMSATGGKVALVNATTPLGCNGGSTPCSPAALATIVDLIGYDGANFFEGSSPAPTLSNTTAAFRANSGCTDTDNNGADFSAATPVPRNIVSPTNLCGDEAPTVASTNPADGATGVSLDTNLTITFSKPVTVTGNWVEMFCFGSGGHTLVISGGPTSFTADPQGNLAPDESCAVTIKASGVAGLASDYTFTFVTGNVVPPDAAPAVTSTTPPSGATNVPVGSNVTVVFSEQVALSGGVTLSCSSSGAHSVSISGSGDTWTLDPAPDFSLGDTCTVTIPALAVSDVDTNDPPDNMQAEYSWSFSTAAPPTPIHAIQGASHISPFNGQTVAGVGGIVTAKRSNGFYMQDPNPDADDATSEGIFVFLSSAPVNVGDAVRVNGNVAEFRPGGVSSTNLTTTEIASPSISVLSSNNDVPAPTVVGSGGRVPPGEVIEDDASGSVETSGVFDPASDGIDFYESLEGMRLQVNNPVVVGPRSSFGEIFVLADNGAGATVRTARGGILLRANDGNPEKMQFDDAILAGSTPNASVGDHFTGPAVGILDYDFGNFELNLTSALTTVSAGLAREVTANPNANQLTVATFNVENLDANEPQSKFDALAGEIVNNLRSPDVISLEEIQDNNGATNDSVVDASDTYAKLIGAISAAGGPSYAFRQINPVDDQDGGEPGGNIRVGFLFNTDRGVAFVDRPGGGSTTATTVVNDGGKPQLSASPGRVAPTNAAWNASRKPLAGEFTFRGQTFFMIANHFNSKGGDQPLVGRFQPPVRSSETQRHQQAQLVHDFVDSILAVDANAKVIVLGDINDFEFSETVSILKGTALEDLMDTLPLDQRYSYVFEGNSQVLDHILVSHGLFAAPLEFDPVHVNAEFFDQLSDHDPSVARFTFNSAPSVDAGGPYSVDEGGTVSLSATGNDPEGDTLTYAWDLDGNGSFETNGNPVTFSAATLDGPSSRTVAVRVSDGTSSATDQATVSIENVPPTATFNAPTTTPAGFPFTLSLSSPHDPSTADTTTGFTYSFDCGDGSGYSVFGSASSASCATAATGTRTVQGKIRDKDGGVNEYSATVRVVVTFNSLCALVRAYSSDPSVADALCAKLADAADAPTATARAGHLNAFRNQVDAKIGKAFTPQQAAVLKQLSTEL